MFTPSPHRSRLRYHAPLVYAGSNVFAVGHRRRPETRIESCNRGFATVVNQISYGCLISDLEKHITDVTSGECKTVKFKDPQRDASC